MVNVNKLNGKIAEAGMTKPQVAKAIGMNQKTFYNRLRGRIFNSSEIVKLVKLLNISNVDEIFFDGELTNK